MGNNKLNGSFNLNNTSQGLFKKVVQTLPFKVHRGHIVMTSDGLNLPHHDDNEKVQKYLNSYSN